MKVKETKGITLIALVITIVVLLILAGVVIATLNGNDNIIKNANTAVGKYNEKVNEEQGILDTLEEKLREYTNGGSSNPPTPGEQETPPTTPTVDSNGLATKPTTIKPDEKNNPNLQIVIPVGFAPAILQTGTTQSLPGQDGSVKNKMPASQWNNITADDINKGIVVVDADGNEFVWIPITDASKFARVDWTTKYGYDVSGKWNSSGTLTTPHPLSEEISPTIGWWEDKTTDEYKNMVTSVTNNKGFYVARYEASANDDSSKAQSKRGATTWIKISQTNAIDKSKNYNSALHSHLMYGIEWDSILNWLNGNATISKDGQNTAMGLTDLQTNSCSWGNFNDSTGNAATNKGYPQTTGKSEYWKANNIYDLAGNVWEWTQEKWSTSTFRASRGGHYNFGGDKYPAAHRSSDIGSFTNEYVGFRSSFYL